MNESGFLSRIRKYSLYLAWIVSLIAVGGSLYFSEIAGYVPCKLCWLQRIFMYPLVIILGKACYSDDRRQIGYVLPLSMIGGAISLYHYMEQKIPGMAGLMPCTSGVPCNTDYINWLGFITIPFLALIAFSLITIILWIGKERAPQFADEAEATTGL
ncbi:MAG: thiol-disulfide oxidoreductase-like protein [Paenibacillus sp.]|jgi:disulfide bond formation protein DsbB|uniref:Disulfide bond formation protein B n=1 Tax=Paenibacillus hemerocallicola TaxID=1172614 RepID=A0A5C4SVY7_9BACL|nr:disulfide oxidoreductase [Paenibacillus hemerocallicola]MDF2661569.1 thiol-disulfide oxidoreductase-like protein [Paenibacillus sp.]TNJ57730.1 disulfide bond formation protein B [Paenibacillus hemerocallicola]